MKAGSNLREIEQAVAREIADFWAWLGASETPEDWESGASSPPEPSSNHGRTPHRDGGHTRHPPPS